MKKINIIGERHIAHFKNELNEEITEISSDTDYNERFITGSNPPIKEGYKWISSARATWFDTLDGYIHDGQYAIQGEVILIRLSEDKLLTLTKSEVKMVTEIPPEDLI